MIIGLVAPSGTGKTVVAKRLKKRHGFARIHAGAPLKRAFRAGFGLTKAEVSGDSRIDEPARAMGGVAPRPAMDAAAAAIHAKAPHATAVQLGRALDRKAAKGRDIVVDGVRSPHEAEAIRRRGGVIVRVSRPGISADPELAMDRLQQGIAADHQIEHPGTKKGLRAEADKLAMRLVKP